MSTILSIACCGANPVATEVVDRVDLIEVNHLYDQQGRHVIDQLIFYDWDQVARRFQVRAWRLLKSDDHQPRRSWARDEYVATWRDQNIVRRVHAFQTRETWTNHDPEVLEREMYPMEQRLELSQPEPLSRFGLPRIDLQVSSQDR
jgi:hypothetical protein